MRFLWSVLAIACVLVVTPLMAHHGWAGYSEKEFEITGKLEKPVSMAGAHATMTINVDGQVWDVTLAPPARTSRAGLNATTIPVGAMVTVHCHRHNDPKRFEVKTERVAYDGKLYNVYPERD